MGNCEYCGRPLIDGQICPCQLDKIAKRQAELKTEEKEASEEAFQESKRIAKGNSEKLKEMADKKDKAMDNATEFLASVISLYKNEITQEEFVDAMSMRKAAALNVVNVLFSSIIMFLYADAFFISVTLSSSFGLGNKILFLIMLALIVLMLAIMITLEKTLTGRSFEETIKRNATAGVVLIPIGLVGVMTFLIPLGITKALGVFLFYMYAIVILYSILHFLTDSKRVFFKYMVIAGIITGIFTFARMFLFT